MARKSFRQRFVFWLDIEKDHEADIAAAIDGLKQKRSFSKTIRDGIRLIVDLRAGRTDVLFELFPLLKAKLQADFDGSAGNALTEEKIRAIFQEATSNLPSPVVATDLSLLDGNHQSNVLPVPSFDGLFDDGFKPMTAAERETDMAKREEDREQSVVKKVENKTDGIAQSSTNFMSMISNIQSGKGGW